MESVKMEKCIERLKRKTIERDEKYLFDAYVIAIRTIYKNNSVQNDQLDIFCNYYHHCDSCRVFNRCDKENIKNWLKCKVQYMPLSIKERFEKNHPGLIDCLLEITTPATASLQITTYEIDFFGELWQYVADGIY